MNWVKLIVYSVVLLILFSTQITKADLSQEEEIIEWKEKYGQDSNPPSPFVKKLFYIAFVVIMFFIVGSISYPEVFAMMFSSIRAFFGISILLIIFYNLIIHNMDHPVVAFLILFSIFVCPIINLLK